MICKKCQAEIENGLMYCPKCGEPIQLVPEYDVLEEELLSKVVEDKRKSKDDKFANGVYQVNEEDKEPVPQTKVGPVKEPLVFTKKIITLIIIAIVAVGILSVLLIVPYVSSHTYDNSINEAMTAESKEEYAKALGYYEEAYDIDPDSLEAVFGLGRMYYQVNDYENALSMLKLAVSMDPDNIDIYTYMLDCLNKLGDTDAIYDLYETSSTEEIKTLISQYILLPPEFSVPAGEYESDQIIQLTSGGNYKIFYTINGKNPINSGKLYSKPITIKEGTTTIKAVAQNNSGEYSQIAEAEYIISYPELGMPVVSPTDGVYTDLVMISIEVPEGCRAYYTWDGTDPATNGILYTEPFAILEGSSVLSAVLIDEDGNVGPVYRGNYIYQPNTN